MFVLDRVTSNYMLKFERERLDAVEPPFSSFPNNGLSETIGYTLGSVGHSTNTLRNKNIYV